MAKNSNSVVEIVKELAEPIADSLDCWVWDVEFVKEGTRKILRIIIDSEEGVDIDLCEKMHRAIDVVLDEVDPTFGAPYTLNVSSPGVDRPLKTKRDFEKCMGKQVEVKLFAPMMGKKFFEAELIGFDGNCVMLKDKNGEMKLELSKIAKINQAISFEGLGD